MNQPAKIAEPARGVTGVENSKVGMWWFLASEVMMFGGLLGSYVLLKSANLPLFEESAGMLNKTLATINTLVLITSSATVAMSVAAIKKGDVRRMNIFLTLTIFLGLTFLGVKGAEYGHKFHHEIYPSTNLFFAAYFLLTGLHALHVFLGIIIFLGVLVQASRGKYTERHHDTIENAGLYWHFVDIVWIFLFPLFYLV